MIMTDIGHSDSAAAYCSTSLALCLPEGASDRSVDEIDQKNISDENNEGGQYGAVIKTTQVGATIGRSERKNCNSFVIVSL